MMNYGISHFALIDGRAVAYWECSEKMLTREDLGGYLGEGVIYSIDGEIQPGKRRYHFWAKPTTTRVERWAMKM